MALYMLDPNGIVTSWNWPERLAQSRAYFRPKKSSDSIFSRFYFRGATGPAGVAGARALATAGQAGRYESGKAGRVPQGRLVSSWASVVIDAIHDEQGPPWSGFAKIQRVTSHERREAQAQS